MVANLFEELLNLQSGFARFCEVDIPAVLCGLHKYLGLGAWN